MNVGFLGRLCICPIHWYIVEWIQLLSSGKSVFPFFPIYSLYFGEVYSGLKCPDCLFYNLWQAGLGAEGSKASGPWSNSALENTQSSKNDGLLIIFIFFLLQLALDSVGFAKGKN